MREIKFRAWDKEGGHMIDLYKVTPMALDSNLKQDGVFIPFNPLLELMQYTGLKDKNGKEIYEGDIIWLGKYNKDTGEKIIEIVNWIENKVRFSLDIDRLWGEPDSFYSRSPLFEIIGNIYENPELLKINQN